MSTNRLHRFANKRFTQPFTSNATVPWPWSFEPDFAPTEGLLGSRVGSSGIEAVFKRLRVCVHFYKSDQIQGWVYSPVRPRMSRGQTTEQCVESVPCPLYTCLSENRDRSDA